MEKPSVWIVILNWENAQETLACLKTWEHVAYPQKHILVVDNGSRDNSIKMLNAYHPPYPYTVLSHKENLGYAEGNNVGVRYALRHNPDYICVLNNDTRVDAKFLEKLIDDAERNPGAGIWGPLIYCLPDKDGKDIWFAGGMLKWADIARIGKHFLLPKNNEGYETEFVTGCCVLARSSVWKKLRGFDSRFFLYFEDLDFNLRAQKQGWACRVVPHAVIWHKVSATSLSKLGGARMLYYHHRNGMLLASLHGPWWMGTYMHAWAGAKIGKNFLKYMVGRDREIAETIMHGIRDFYRHQFGKLSE